MNVDGVIGVQWVSHIHFLSKIFFMIILFILLFSCDELWLISLRAVFGTFANFCNRTFSEKSSWLETIS